MIGLLERHMQDFSAGTDTTGKLVLLGIVYNGQLTKLRVKV